MKWILATLVAIVLAAGYLWFQRPEQALAVETVMPIKKDISLTIEETGAVVNDRVVKLTALVNGRIATTRFNVGDHVDANAVVATFDAKEAHALFNKAEAEVTREQHAVENTKRRLDRLERVTDSSGATQQARDEAHYEHESAIARLQVAEANRNLYAIKRDQTVLSTPYAGIVIEKTSEAGQWMEAGTLLYTLVADEGFEIEAKIDAAELARVEMNMIVDAFLEDQPEIRWQAPVHWISPAVIRSDGNDDNKFAVRLPVTASTPPLRLNQQIQLLIPIETAKDTLVLPTSTLLVDANEDQVAVIEAGRIRRTTVKLGIETVDEVEILEGLKPEDVVAIPNGAALDDGASVNVVSQEK